MGEGSAEVLSVGGGRRVTWRDRGGRAWREASLGGASRGGAAGQGPRLGAGTRRGGSLRPNRGASRWSRSGSPPGRARGGSGWAGAMELLKLNRSAQGSGPGPGASLCRPGGALLNSSGAGNLSCEPPRIRGAGTRGGCLPKPPPPAPSRCTPH